MCVPFGRITETFSLAIAQWKAISVPRGDQAGESRLPKAFAQPPLTAAGSHPVDLRQPGTGAVKAMKRPLGDQLGPKSGR